MKRFLFLTLTMLATMGAWAQNTHFQLSYDPSEEGAYGSTVVYAKLDLTPASDVFRPYEVAAFIGDECRAIATYGTTNPAQPTVADYNYWVLNVKGKFDNSDNEVGQAITFKLYDSEKEVEYVLTPDRDITFGTESQFGEPSNLVVLSAVEWEIEATDETLFCNVGDDIIELIKNYYTILPTDAEQTPPNVIYSIGNNTSADEISVSQNSIVPLTTGYMWVKCELEGTGLSCEVEIRAQNWATGGQADPSTLEVTYYDEELDILDQVKPLITFGPEGYEDIELSVESDDPDVVEPSIEVSDGELYGSVYVKGTGTATLTFTVSYPDYLEELGSETTKESTFTLTVIVKQGLLNLEISEKLITVNKGETFDLTTIIKPYPENAEVDYSKLSYVITEAYTNSIKVEKNILTGLEVVEHAQLGICYDDLPNFNSLLLVDVVNPAKALVVNTPEITVNKGDSEALTAALATAVTMDPADASDQIFWVSGDETIVAPLTVAEGWNPLAGGDVTMTAEIRDYADNDYTVRLSKTITVHVVVPVESITIKTSGITWLNVGDDPTDYLNSVVEILPEDATNKSYHFEVTGRFTTADGRVLASQTGVGRVKAVADDGSGVESAYTNFSIFLQASDVSFGGDIITSFNGTEIDISEQVKNNITFVPENASYVIATTTSSNPEVASVNVTIRQTATNTPVEVTVNATAKAIGETTVTMAITYADFLANLIDPRQDHSTTVERTFKIIVKEGLSGFTADYPEEMAVGGTYQIVLTPQPADSDVDLSAFSMSTLCESLPEGWTYMTFGEPQKQSDGTIVITVNPQEPLNGYLYVSYSDGTTELDAISRGTLNVGVAMTLDEGWQWSTLWGPIESFEDYFGNDGIVEVRSQDELMAYDSGIGYFGDLYDNGLQNNVAYKIKAKSAIAFDKASVLHGGSILVDPMSQSLLRGWTWIPYPYIHSIALSSLGIAGTVGDRIVAKTGGFADYDGTDWVGTLTKLEPWQAYLYYNSGEEATSFLWAGEKSVYNVDYNADEPQTNVVPAGNARRKVSLQSSWQYDPRPYRDNMSMVAEVEGLTMPEQFSVGAFVDDECRGEGVCIDGRMFITVHANQGEQVSFRLRNEVTGEQYDVDQTVRMQLMLGTLKAPFRLSSQGVATGINSVHSSEFTVHSYDLGGRAVKANDKGMTIQRRADGTVRKVVRK